MVTLEVVRGPLLPLFPSGSSLLVLTSSRTSSYSVGPSSAVNRRNYGERRTRESLSTVVSGGEGRGSLEGRKRGKKKG